MASEDNTGSHEVSDSPGQALKNPHEIVGRNWETEKKKITAEARRTQSNAENNSKVKSRRTGNVQKKGGQGKRRDKPAWNRE